MNDLTIRQRDNDDTDLAVHHAVCDLLDGYAATAGAAAGEFAARVKDAVTEMREDAEDARKRRRHARRMARLAELLEERRTTDALLGSADDATRAVLSQRLAEIDLDVASVTGVSALPAPAPTGKVRVKGHLRGKAGVEAEALANGEGVAN